MACTKVCFNQIKNNGKTTTPEQELISETS